jgi:integrase
MRRILIDSRDLERLIERWKEVNDTAPTAMHPQPRKEEPRMGMTYKRGTVWWVKYYRNGRPIRESSHSSKESDAINLLKLREGDIAHGLPVNPKLNRIRFDETAEDLKTEYTVNGRRSADELERRIRLHLLPHFGGRRLSSITTADVNAFILKRQKDVMVVGDGEEREERRYSNGEINRELTTLKRILNLARQNGKLMHVPHVPMLKERTVRTGFFEREQIERILAHLPPAIRPAVRFAHITDWRIPSEVLKLQWRHVDFEAASSVWTRTRRRTAKAAPSRSPTLERLVEAQKTEHERLKAEGVICP